MNIPAKSFLLSCLLAAIESSAQGVGALLPTPSAVDDNVPLLRPLVGTLFVDQLDRERMNDARKRGDASFQGTPTYVTPSVLDGFVKRSDGKSIVWVDGVPRTMSDERMIARVQPASVGLESTTIIFRDLNGEAALIEPARTKAPGKSRKTTGKSDSVTLPPGK